MVVVVKDTGGGRDLTVRSVRASSSRRYVVEVAFGARTWVQDEGAGTKEGGCVSECGGWCGHVLRVSTSDDDEDEDEDDEE